MEAPCPSCVYDKLSPVGDPLHQPSSLPFYMHSRCWKRGPLVSIAHVLFISFTWRSKSRVTAASINSPYPSPVPPFSTVATPLLSRPRPLQQQSPVLVSPPNPRLGRDRVFSASPTFPRPGGSFSARSASTAPHPRCPVLEGSTWALPLSISLSHPVTLVTSNSSSSTINRRCRSMRGG